jgi:hypothetical protein
MRDMTNVLMLPALIGALLSVVVCATLVPRKRLPSFWLALVVAFVVGAGFTLFTFGASFFTLRFWTDNAVFDPAVGGVLLTFGMFAVAAFAAASAVVILYRAKWAR